MKCLHAHVGDALVRGRAANAIGHVVLEKLARDGVETAHGTRHAHGTEGAIGEGASHENGDGGIDADATAHRDASASAADRRKSREGSRGWAAQR